MKTTKTINKDNTIQPGRLVRSSQRRCPTIPRALVSITFVVGVTAMFALLMTAPFLRAGNILGYEVSATTGNEAPRTDSGTETVTYPTPDYGVDLPTVRFFTATADARAWANYRKLKALATVLGKAGPFGVTAASGKAFCQDICTFRRPGDPLFGRLGTATVAVELSGSGSASEQLGWGSFAEMDAEYRLVITKGIGTNTTTLVSKHGKWVSVGGSPTAVFTGDPIPPGSVTFDLPFTWGTAFDLTAVLTVTTIFSGSPMVSGLGSAAADFSHTFTWLGIQSVRDENGNLITDYTLTSASGTDWTRPPNTANNPPTITCPAPAIIACTSADGATATVTVGIGDADNDPLTVSWLVDSGLVSSPPVAPGATTASLTYLFGFGPHTVKAIVGDGKSQPVTCETTVTVTAHDAPVPSLATLPTIQGECAASITETPTAIDVCADGGLVWGTTTDPLTYTAQGTYTVTWTYADPHDPTLFTTQPQTVVVKDITPPTITCPPDVAVAFPAPPAAATTVAEFIAQGGTITDNCDPNGTVESRDVADGTCAVVITRTYVVTDAAGNESRCEQTITGNNLSLFAEDGIVWHQPLARNGMSEDTNPGGSGTLKYRFNLGSTIPIQIHVQGCSGEVTANANVTGTVAVFGDTDCDGVADAGDLSMDIDYNGVGDAGGVMDKIDGHLKYNLDTKKLVQTSKCYVLQVTVTDSSTGESIVETVPLQAR